MKVEGIEEAAPAPAAAQPAATPVHPALAGITFFPDSRGRNIGLKKLKPSERYLLSKNVPITNESTFMQALAVASVHSIGDEAFPPLKDEADLLKRLDELGDEGLAAIMEHVDNVYGGAITKEQAATAKNS